MKNIIFTLQIVSIILSRHYIIIGGWGTGDGGGGGGRSGGAKVLGKLLVPTELDKSRARAIALAVGSDWGSLDIFSPVYLSSFLSVSLGDDPIQTEILSRRAVKPETTNQHEYWPKG